MNHFNLGINSIIFGKNAMNADLRDDIFLHRILKKGRWG